MDSLKDKLYESLLDDEDDLINDDEHIIIDKIRNAYVLDDMEFNEKNIYIKQNKLYIQDWIDSFNENIVKSVFTIGYDLEYLQNIDIRIISLSNKLSKADIYVPININTIDQLNIKCDPHAGYESIMNFLINSIDTISQVNNLGIYCKQVDDKSIQILQRFISKIKHINTITIYVFKFRSTDTIYKQLCGFKSDELVTSIDMFNDKFNIKNNSKELYVSSAEQPTLYSELEYTMKNNKFKNFSILIERPYRLYKFIKDSNQIMQFKLQK